LTRPARFYILSRMISIWRYTSIFAALILIGCSEERASQQSEANGLTVDASLLGPSHADAELRLRFYPPVQFQTADSVFVARYGQDIRNATRNDPYEVLPSMIFSIPESNARCFVSTFFNSPQARFDEAWRAGYLEAARTRARTNEFESEMVKQGDREILAVTVQGAGLVNRRFLFETPQGRIVQIDYLLPDELAPALAAGVESSIGSLTFY
jgi:hypothetical protein